MRSLVLKAFVLVLVLSGCVHSQSSESPKYDSSSSAVRNYDNLTRIEDVLELFSVDVIGSQWKTIYSRLSHHCANDMVAYLSGLEKKEIWAIKSKFSSRFCNRGGWPSDQTRVKTVRNFTFQVWSRRGEPKKDEKYFTLRKCYTLIMLIQPANKAPKIGGAASAPERESTKIIWIWFKAAAYCYIKAGSKWRMAFFFRKWFRVPATQSLRRLRVKT